MDGESRSPLLQKQKQCITDIVNETFKQPLNRLSLSLSLSHPYSNFG